MRRLDVRMLVALCAAGALAGCGGATGSGVSGTSSSQPVRYGVLSCFTGSEASLGESLLQGAEVAAAVINRGGGVLGRQVEVVHADTSCAALDAVPAIKNLLAQGVTGIVGPETVEINSVEPLFDAAHVIDIFQGGDTGRDHQQDPYLFRDNPSDSQLGVAMAVYAHRQGYLRGALMIDNDPGAQTLTGPISRVFTKLGGTIVADIPITPGQTSYAGELREVTDRGAQVIFTETDTPTAGVLFHDARAVNGLTIPFIGSDVSGGSDYLKAVGLQVAHDHLLAVYGTTVAGPASEEFTRSLTALTPGQAPMANASYAYDAIVSLALAQEEAHSLDGVTVKDRMTAVTNSPGQACYSYAGCLTLLNNRSKINYEGASGTLDYDQYHNAFGPYGVFRSDASGVEQQIGLLDEQTLRQASS